MAGRNLTRVNRECWLYATEAHLDRHASPESTCEHIGHAGGSTSVKREHTLARSQTHVVHSDLLHLWQIDVRNDRMQISTKMCRNQRFVYTNAEGIKKPLDSRYGCTRSIRLTQSYVHRKGLKRTNPSHQAQSNRRASSKSACVCCETHLNRQRSPESTREHTGNALASACVKRELAWERNRQLIWYILICLSRGNKHTKWPAADVDGNVKISSLCERER